MKKELKTIGKRIAASALAIATAFVLLPFGSKEAKAETYNSGEGENGSITISTDGTVDSTGAGSIWEDENVVCGFYGSVSFDSVTVDASAKTVTFKNLNCASELSTLTNGWTFIFDGTCETVIVLEEGAATIQVTAGSTLTCPKIFAPAGISLGENTVMTPEDADVTDVMNPPSVVFSSTEEATTEATSYTVTAGGGSSHTVGAGEDLTLTCDGALEDLVSISVDGTVIDAENYTLKSGSTILTLKAGFLDKLSAGEHTVTFTYKDGKAASASFTIAAAATEATTAASSSPKTADSAIPYAAFILLGLAVAAGAFSMKKSIR